MTYKAYAVSWNLTQRCNLFCAHCYISGAPSASAAGELSTEECRRVMADIARVNPGTFLILTGGEPLLRPDIFELAAEGREHGFTVVLGTNGVLLRQKQARLMKTHGVQGASLSLDSVDAARHDEFRHLPGAWKRRHPGDRGAPGGEHRLLAPHERHRLERRRDSRDDRPRAGARRARSQLLLPRPDRPRRRAHRHHARAVRGDPDLSGPRRRGRAARRRAPASGLRARAARGPLERARRPCRRPPHPREVRAALPAGALRAGSRARRCSRTTRTAPARPASTTAASRRRAT